MSNRIVLGLLAAALTSMIFVAGWGTTNGYAQTSNVTSSRAAATSNTQGTVVRDSAVPTSKKLLPISGKKCQRMAYVNL